MRLPRSPLQNRKPNPPPSELPGLPCHKCVQLLAFCSCSFTTVVILRVILPSGLLAAHTNTNIKLHLPRFPPSLSGLLCVKSRLLSLSFVPALPSALPTATTCTYLHTTTNLFMLALPTHTYCTCNLHHPRHSSAHQGHPHIQVTSHHIQVTFSPLPTTPNHSQLTTAPCHPSCFAFSLFVTVFFQMPHLCWTAATHSPTRICHFISFPLPCSPTQRTHSPASTATLPFQPGTCRQAIECHLSLWVSPRV
jgi:hypothetical protein